MAFAERIASFIARRPWVALAIVMVLGWLMWSGTAEFRTEASPPSWLVWVVVALAVYGALFGLVLVPRLVEERDWKLVLLQWAGCLTSFVVAWAAWFLLGVSGWVLALCVAITVVSLLVIVTNRA